MTDLIQSATLVALAVTCIVQGIAMGNLRRAIGFNTEAIAILATGRKP